MIGKIINISLADMCLAEIKFDPADVKFAEEGWCWETRHDSPEEITIRSVTLEIDDVADLIAAGDMTNMYIRVNDYDQIEERATDDNIIFDFTPSRPLYYEEYGRIGMKLELFLDYWAESDCGGRFVVTRTAGPFIIKIYPPAIE